MKGICLCSGGLDSTLCLLRLLKTGHQVTPVFFDYGQWQVEEERRAVEEVYNWVVSSGLQQTLVYHCARIRWDSRPERVGSAWGRTLALVGLATMWAYTHGNDYSFIALGNHKGDVSPDLDPTSINKDLQKLLQTATKGVIQIVSPIVDLSNEDVGQELAVYGIPWNYMYSCYWSPPCGYRSKNETYRCPGCRRKVVSMRAAGVTDQSLLGLPNTSKRSYQSPLAVKVEY